MVVLRLTLSQAFLIDCLSSPSQKQFFKSKTIANSKLLCHPEQL
jgi:hypothetical protein